MMVPKEVSRYFADHKCPLCKTPLSGYEEDIIVEGVANDLGDAVEYFANSSCSQCLDYYLEVHFSDPKHLQMAVEWLFLLDEEYEYEAIIQHDPISTRMVARLPNTDGKKAEVVIDGLPLELGKSSIKTLISEIRLLLLLA